MNRAPVVAPTAPAALADEARRKLSSADSAALLVEAMDAYRAVLRADPLDYEALVTLANLHTLLGTAYTTSRREKARNFRQGIWYAELAMYTNPRFRELADAGVKPWDASHVLTEREAEAMFFWVTGVFYLFKEGMSLPGKISNLVWIERSGRFLGRLDQIDPEWRGGALQFSWALYYYILPRSRGGNKALARVFLDRSIKDSPEWLVTRWGRAGYFHVSARDEAGFKRDLEWVLAQDITRPGGELFAWKVHFQRNAGFSWTIPRDTRGGASCRRGREPEFQGTPFGNQWMGRDECFPVRGRVWPGGGDARFRVCLDGTETAARLAL